MKTTKKTIEVTRNDNGVIINKETGEPHFPELYEKQKEIEISVRLNFSENAPSLKKQIKEQGFKFPNKRIEIVEQIKDDLHALNKIGIISQKQLLKCFKKLSKKVSYYIVNNLSDETQTPIHLKTELSK